jgi:adenosylhomocysteinase
VTQFSTEFSIRRRGLQPNFVANMELGIDFTDRTVDITGQLKVLKELTEETKNPDNTHSIILQHILPTTVEFIDRVNSVYPVDLIISITYSTDQKTVEVLRSKGYSVLVPPDINYMLNSLWKDVTAVMANRATL